MSSDDNYQLTDDVKNALPPRGQDVYREAFLEAWKRYGMSPRDESRAHIMAWAAVRKQFHQDESGAWVEGASEDHPRQVGTIDERHIF